MTFLTTGFDLCQPAPSQTMSGHGSEHRPGAAPRQKYRQVFYWEHRYSPGVQSPKIRELTVHCELCMLGSTQPGFVIKTRRGSRSGPSWVAAGTCSQPPSCCCICVLPVPGCHHTPCVAADAHPCANGTASERAACVTNEVKKKPEPTTGFL